MDGPTVVPRMYVKSRGEQTTKLSLQLTCVPRKCVVRLTGGCGSMSPKDAEGLYELFTEAFRGFDGAMLFGGTRMLAVDDRKTVVPGITEVPPMLRAGCPGMVALGVIPRTQELRIADEGMVVSEDGSKPFVTVIHPHQDIVLVVQVSADDPEIWDAEYQECLRLTRDLREYAGFASILVAYNGGTVTSREIEAVAECGWPVVLVRGSGRATDRYAADDGFLRAYPSVVVADRDADDMRRRLEVLGALPRRLELVRAKRA